MSDIYIEKKNEVYLRVKCDKGIAYELSEYFSFFAPNYKFMPAFRNKMWDGKIRLFQLKNHEIYCGLADHLIRFAEDNDYTIEFEKDRLDQEFSVVEAEEFIEAVKLPEKFEIRNYQLKCFIDSVRKSRQVNLMDTGSGKSLVIYLLSRFYEKKTLIIVPTITLVSQMAGDFKDYGYTKEIHKITAGVEKLTDHRITISTWQSIHKMPKSWFDQFKLVIVDEAHYAKAAALTGIMNKLEDCKYRFAFTGTLDGTATSQIVIEGLFGPVKEFTKTVDLIAAKHLADFRIKALVLKYNDTDCKTIKAFNYQDEIDFIVRNHERNKFITNLALSLKGNTLVLFQFVEKHGEILHKMIKEKAKGRNVYYIAGSVKGDVREEIRRVVETEKDAIIVASSGTTSTGTNIVNLSNIIFTSPTKAKIRTLQSIGRSLRRNGDEISTLYDIVDNLTWKTRENYAIKHFKERLKIYSEKEFEFKVYNIDLH